MAAAVVLFFPRSRHWVAAQRELTFGSIGGVVERRARQLREGDILEAERVFEFIEPGDARMRPERTAARRVTLCFQRSAGDGKAGLFRISVA